MYCLDYSYYRTGGDVSNAEFEWLSTRVAIVSASYVNYGECTSSKPAEEGGTNTAEAVAASFE